MSDYKDVGHEYWEKDHPPVDHIPGYEFDERTRYRCRIKVDGFVQWTGTFETMVEVQKDYILMRNNSGFGASQFSSGDVFDERGQHIGRISYNGRLWEPWTGQFIASAPREEAT